MAKIWLNKAKNVHERLVRKIIEKLDRFLEFNEYNILENYESMQNTTADAKTEIQYIKLKPI